MTEYIISPFTGEEVNIIQMHPTSGQNWRSGKGKNGRGRPRKNKKTK